MDTSYVLLALAVVLLVIGIGIVVGYAISNRKLKAEMETSAIKWAVSMVVFRYQLQTVFILGDLRRIVAKELSENSRYRDNAKLWAEAATELGIRETRNVSQKMSALAAKSKEYATEQEIIKRSLQARLIPLLGEAVKQTPEAGFFEALLNVLELSGAELIKPSDDPLVACARLFWRLQLLTVDILKKVLELLPQVHYTAFDLGKPKQVFEELQVVKAQLPPRQRQILESMVGTEFQEKTAEVS